MLTLETISPRNVYLNVFGGTHFHRSYSLNKVKKNLSEACLNGYISMTLLL